MVTQLLQHERIQTTLARAKQLRKLADRVITWAKQGDKTAERRVERAVRTERERHTALTTLAERYADRPGGYTRVLRAGRRERDAAQMAFVELVDREGELRPARPPPEWSRPAPPPGPEHVARRARVPRARAARAQALPGGGGDDDVDAPAAVLRLREKYAHLPLAARRVLEQEARVALEEQERRRQQAQQPPGQ
jgi:large subunit ribosomal protein L17